MTGVDRRILRERLFGNRTYRGPVGLGVTEYDRGS